MKYLRKIDREEFVSSLTDKKEDRFAKTFIAKCDMMQNWDKCRGVFVGQNLDKLAGAIVVTISKRKPKVANLQLLHTFHEFRGNGIASVLCDWGIAYAYEMEAEYFRVSSELDAVKFYEKYGFKFVCRQKTAQLAMFRLTSTSIKTNNFEIDSYIWKQMNKKGKGGCIECFVEYKGVDFYTAV